MQCSRCTQCGLAHRQAYMRKVLQALVCIVFLSVGLAHPGLNSMVDAYPGESPVNSLVPSKYGSLYYLSTILLIVLSNISRARSPLVLSQQY